MSGTAGIRRLGRFVITILLLAALAPTISRAARFAFDGVLPYAALCSAQSSGDETGDAAGVGVDCPLCLLQAHGSLGPPAVADPAASLPALGSERPWTLIQSPRANPARLLAQPRAPPAPI